MNDYGPLPKTHNSGWMPSAYVAKRPRTQMKYSGGRFKQVSSERASLDESNRGHQYDEILANMHDAMQYRKKM